MLSLVEGSSSMSVGLKDFSDWVDISSCAEVETQVVGNSCIHDGPIEEMK